jgi:selenocysteine lyase/cysteine desulfurase
MRQDRRQFLTALGALSASGLAAHRADAAGVRSDDGPTEPEIPRGLAKSSDILLDPTLTYLQTGSLGPTPRPVMERTLAVWRELELDPTSKGYGSLEREMEGVRSRAAAFIGCAIDELVLTRCTTEGLNWVAQGIHWSAGERIITTDQEHPGGRACYDWVARRYGVALDVVTIPPGENDPAAIVQRFADRITPKTRAFAFSHLLTSTGLRMPVAELSALARRAGAISIVDGAQAVGAVAVDVKALGCHVYATSGHKWLLAPKGTGLLYLSRDLAGRVDPVALQSGREAYTASSGVSSLPSVHGLLAAIAYHEALGVPRIEAHNVALGAYLWRALAAVPAVRIVSAAPGALASPLLTYALPASVPAGALHQRLMERHRVEVKVVPGNFLNGQRISTHLFNTERDVDALVSALRAELA